MTSHKVEALIVEYDSNVTFSFSHDEMSEFYTSVNDWFSSVIKTAPPQLRSGFFLSHLGFYDVQNSLLQDTLMAISLAMTVAIIVVFASTLNIGLTFLGEILQNFIDDKVTNVSRCNVNGIYNLWKVLKKKYILA